MEQVETEQTDKAPITKMSYRLSELLQLFGVSKPSIYRWIKKNGFPEPIKIGQISLWPVISVDSWWRKQSTISD